MDPDIWFDELQAALADASSAGDVGEMSGFGGVAGYEPAADSVPSRAETDALLDLARVAAHTSERWTAPISTFLVGVALAGVPPRERAARLRALVTRLEADPGTDG